MALDKNYKDYYYNLGRCVALVQVINNLDGTFRSLVFDNAFEKLPYQLNEALRKDNNVLHAELLQVADVVLNERTELPKGVLTAYDDNGKYWIGIYHQQAYLNEKYKGMFGDVETIVTENIPQAVAPITTNEIDELKR